MSRYRSSPQPVLDLAVTEQAGLRQLLRTNEQLGEIETGTCTPKFRRVEGTTAAVQECVALLEAGGWRKFSQRDSSPTRWATRSQ